MEHLLMVALLYLLPAGGITLAILAIGKKKGAEWFKGEWIFVVLPLVLWMAMVSWQGESKTMTNVLFEPLVCGLTAGLILLPRLWLGNNENLPGKLRTTLLCTLLAAFVTLSVFVFVPTLPV